MPSAAVLQSMVVQEDPPCDQQVHADQAEPETPNQPPHEHAGNLHLKIILAAKT